MRDQQDEPASSLRAGVIRWAERLFVMAGAGVLIWCAVLVADSAVTQWNARRLLATMSIPDLPALPPAPAAITGVSPRDPPPRRGSPIAALSIPRVHLSAVVLHGSDAQTLRRGPGHLEHTALPGESGNAVIAGHRDSFFWPLRNVQLGDDVFVDTPGKRFHYQVSLLRVVDPHNVSVLEPTSDATLTLITCYPFWVVGPAPDRLVVRATRVTDSTAPALESRTRPLSDEIFAPAAAAMPSQSALVAVRTVSDDETLVRQAIERLRMTYNARLSSHNDAAPLTFQRCDITLAADQAVATCGGETQSSNKAEPRVVTFTLKRAGGGWEITGIQTVVRDREGA
jgi:sortase A